MDQVGWVALQKIHGVIEYKFGYLEKIEYH